MFVIMLPAYWILVIRQRRKPFSIELILAIGIAISWAVLVVYDIRIGYLRNKPLKIPKTMLPVESEFENKKPHFKP